MRKLRRSILLILVIFFGAVGYCLASNIPLAQIKELPNKITISKQDLNLLIDKKFGSIIKTKLTGNLETSGNGANNVKLNIKLFNIITLKQIDVDIKDINVWAGGDTVGFSLSSNGVIVVGSSAVATENGNVNTLKDTDIKSGDVILEIEGEKVNRVGDLSVIANKEENQGKSLMVKLRRNGKEQTTTITPAKDYQTQKFKLGLWVKDDMSGVGTLTYIRQDNNRFGALGHAICDSESKEPFDVKGGDMYKCTVIGLNKATKGKPGEIKALFVQSGNNSIGSVDKNNRYGVFGTYNSAKLERLNTKETIKVGGRWTAKPGKAKIRVNLDDEIKDYDIEIIKTNYQSSSSDKSMVIRVLDKELLKKTGGIIQGMSGSPIIQNDRVVGAVTHVFVSDPTKGFGIYLDWMINE